MVINLLKLQKIGKKSTKTKIPIKEKYTVPTKINALQKIIKLTDGQKNNS